MALNNQGVKFYIHPTPVDLATVPLDLAAFDALFAGMVRVLGVVDVPSFSVEQNMLTQNTTDTEIAEKQGGVVNGVDTTVSFSFREADDAGIAAMEAAAASPNLFVVAKEMGNKPNATGTGTRYYALAFVGGGGGPGGGGVEDFANRSYTLGISHQRPVEKAAAAGV